MIKGKPSPPQEPQKPKIFKDTLREVTKYISGETLEDFLATIPVEYSQVKISYSMRDKTPFFTYIEVTTAQENEEAYNKKYQEYLERYAKYESNLVQYELEQSNKSCTDFKAPKEKEFLKNLMVKYPEVVNEYISNKGNK